MSADELLKKLEAATNGSRELDVAIYVTMFPYPCVALTSEAQRAFDDEKAPHYTTSLDAALTLLPTGYGAVSAAINERGPSSMRIGHPYVSGNAATPALALCIAALRARGAE